MSESVRLQLRGGLYALGAVQLVMGAWITVAPTSFYDDFPLGRGWVAALPAYNEHLLRDVGALFLATGLLLVVAGVWLERRIAGLALVTFLVFSVPHTIYHLLNLEPYDTGDAVGNALALIATVLLPVYLLWLVVRVSPSEPRPPAP